MANNKLAVAADDTLKPALSLSHDIPERDIRI